MCVITTDWATHVSSECSLGGNGQCDGYCYDHDRQCTCSCHTAFDLPHTVVEVALWHDQRNGVVASINETNPQAEFLLLRQAAVLTEEEPDEHFGVSHGQGRFYIAKTYR